MHSKFKINNLMNRKIVELNMNCYIAQSEKESIQFYEED